ncbi:MAG: hypothetical protein PHN19_00735 [Patescibacteria group bacterium]|nr:hypothetical protein [Patescibacteria group bacterium]
MRSHITKLFLLSSVFIASSVYAEEPEKVPSHPDFSIVLLAGNGQKADLPDAAIEILIAKFAGSSLNLSLAGKEIFGVMSDEEIRTCFATDGCVRNVCITKQMGRMLYGTIIQEKGKAVKSKQEGKKPKKKVKSAKPAKKSTTLLSIELTLFDAINNKIDTSWTCKKCPQEELYEKTIPEIADTAISIMAKNPQIWSERKPSLRADEAALGLQPQEIEVLPPPPVASAEEAKQPEVEVRKEPVVKVEKKIEVKKPGLDWHSWTGIALMSIGAGMVGTGAYFGVDANNARSNYEATNVQRQAMEYMDQSESSAGKANIMYSAGGAILLTGATIFLLDYFEIIHKSTTAPQALIISQPSGLVLNLSF